MKFIFNKKINIDGLRYPKIFSYNEKVYLVGGLLKEIGYYVDNKIVDRTIFNDKIDFNYLKNVGPNQINKYTPHLYEIDNNFNILNSNLFPLDEENRNNIFKSSWVRDIFEKDKKLYITIEHKLNIENKRFEDQNYQYITDDLQTLNEINKYKDNDYFLFKDYKGVLFQCKIEKDKDDKDFFWGIYLFDFLKDNRRYRPKFDKIVDYEKDKGHVIHTIIEFGDEYLMLFTIRHHIKDREFIYKIYSAKTKDFENFYDTKNVEIEKKECDSDWFSYPHLFKLNDKWYAVCNQDDFGKYKDLVLFDVIF